MNTARHSYKEEGTVPYSKRLLASRRHIQHKQSKQTQTELIPSHPCYHRTDGLQG